MIVRSRLFGYQIIGSVMVMTVLFASPAKAQSRGGVQGGISVNPDQLYFGGLVETTPLVDRWRFRPNVNIGVGDNMTLVGLDFDFKYTFAPRASRQPWSLYAGAGPTLNFARANGNSDSNAGFNIFGGAQNSKGMFFELKVGLANGPDMRFGVGYMFK